MSKYTRMITAVALALVVIGFSFAPRPTASADGIADASLKATLARNISSKLQPGQPINAAFPYPEGQLIGVSADHLVYKVKADLYYIPLDSIRAVRRVADGTLMIDWKQ